MGTDSWNDCRGGLAIASRAAVRIDDVQVETSCEPSPRDISRIEQVADVLSRHLYLFAAGAHITERIRITDLSVPAVPVTYQLAGATDVFRDPVGLT